MSIAEDFYKGRCCQWCGVYFEEDHGYPVLCADCFNSQKAKEGDADFIQLASLDEL